MSLACKYNFQPTCLLPIYNVKTRPDIIFSWKPLFWAMNYRAVQICHSQCDSRYVLNEIIFICTPTSEKHGLETKYK